MTKSAKVYLWHIRDAIAAIELYTADGKDAFLVDERTQDAVIYNLAIIGEAVKKLPNSLRSKHRTIPWRAIAGLRDIVIHDYASTEIERIWVVVERDLPKLRRAINRMLIAKVRSIRGATSTEKQTNGRMRRVSIRPTCRP